MTLQQLENKWLGYSFEGYGHFKIGFKIRGIDRFCITTNTMAIDRISDDNCTSRAYGDEGITEKQALEQLYSEVKRKTK